MSFKKKSDGFYYAPEKDPDAKLDYVLDWSTWLGEDVITTSDWTASSGLTVVSESRTSTTTLVWVSGGVAGQTYTVTNRIVTAFGRIQEQSFKLIVREK